MIRYFLSAVVLAWAPLVYAETMKMAVTTSFENSGLADVLLPEIEADLGIEVQLLVVGTGQALRLGEAGDVDAILVHSRDAEEAFVSGGFGTHRREIMYNDFVLIGPENDEVGIEKVANASIAVQKIAQTKATFLSRGDNSGTHKAELDIWHRANLDPETFGAWYRAVGAGMGGALNTASGMSAYILSDRASWLNFKNKANLVLLYSGDPALFNQYAFLPVNPEKHEIIRHDLAMKVEGWLVSEKAADLINGYTIDGETLFVFNAQDQ